MSEEAAQDGLRRHGAAVVAAMRAMPQTARCDACGRTWAVRLEPRAAPGDEVACPWCDEWGRRMTGRVGR